MRALKYSRQRESIKEFLASRYDHPTADTVYENIRKVYPNISLGTVYRNLSLLASLGEIVRITTGDGADRYDGNTSPHYHFVCKECNSVIDLEMQHNPVIDFEANKNFGGLIDYHIAHFFGTCPSCLKKKEKSEERLLTAN